jgi:hypothetical protein
MKQRVEYWEFSLLEVDGIGMMVGWKKITYRANSYRTPDHIKRHMINRDRYRVMGVSVYHVDVCF